MRAVTANTGVEEEKGNVSAKEIPLSPKEREDTNPAGSTEVRETLYGGVDATAREVPAGNATPKPHEGSSLISAGATKVGSTSNPKSKTGVVSVPLLSKKISKVPDVS